LKRRTQSVCVEQSRDCSGIEEQKDASQALLAMHGPNQFSTPIITRKSILSLSAQHQSEQMLLKKQIQALQH